MTPAQTFHDHVHELRRRLFWVIIAIGVSAGISYWLRQPIIRILQRPLGSPLFYTSPAGSFNFVIKLSMVIGLFIALPVLVYQLLTFIKPALPITLSKGRMVKIISASFFLAMAGIAFGFLLMVPMSLHFFSQYANDQIRPLISANEYLTYVLNNLLIFALAFQIPLIILFINWIRPIKPGKLLKYQRHVVVGSFALAIVLPFTYDPLSQFIVAIPIVVLYYLSAFLLWVVNRGRKSKEPALLPVEAPVAPVPQPVVPAHIPVLQPTLATARLAPPVRMPRSTDGIVRRSNNEQPRVVRPITRNTPAYTRRVIPQPRPSFHKGLSLDGFMPPAPLPPAPQQ